MAAQEYKIYVEAADHFGEYTIFERKHALRRGILLNTEDAVKKVIAMDDVIATPREVYEEVFNQFGYVIFSHKEEYDVNSD